MRGVAYEPVYRAKLMALHQQGVPLSGVECGLWGRRGEVIGRWWARYQAGNLAAAPPRPVVAPITRRRGPRGPWSAAFFGCGLSG